LFLHYHHFERRKLLANMKTKDQTLGVRIRLDADDDADDLAGIGGRRDETEASVSEAAKV